MSPSAIVQKLWNYCNVLRDDGMSYGDYVEQAAHDYIVKHYPNMTKDEKRRLKQDTFKGWELVQSTARLCAMNMMLQGIGSDKDLPIVVGDSLAADPGDRFDIVMTNPPFGKKSSTTIVGEEGQVSKERDKVEVRRVRHIRFKLRLE